jgi:hypothetical protein
MLDRHRLRAQQHRHMRGVVLLVMLTALPDGAAAELWLLMCALCICMQCVRLCLLCLCLPCSMQRNVSSHWLHALA